MTLREMMKKYEREVIIEALRRVAPGANHGRGGRIGTVAKELGITRKCLWEKCRALGIDKNAETPQQQLPLGRQVVDGATYTVDFSELTPELQAAVLRGEKIIWAKLPPEKAA